jgi:hypothetical protein
MDMIATTFDIAMFLSRGGDCVQGIARSLRKSAPSYGHPSQVAQQSDAEAGTNRTRQKRHADYCESLKEMKMRARNHNT